MTDTTDKLSLQQLKDVRELCLPHTAWRLIIDELISARDQLEAERQRAERGEAAAGIIQQMYNELKGEQVPYGYAFEDRVGREQFQRTRPVLAQDHRVTIVELFTAPQKPVVLPPLPAAIGDFTESAMKAVRRMDIAAIEASGGIVKDGE